MPDDAPPVPDTSLSRLGKPLQWLVLVFASAAVAALFELGGLPAGLLIGPMVAAIGVAGLGVELRVPRYASWGAQAIVGCLIAASFEPALFAALLDDWPILLGATLATLVASGALGSLIGKLGILPGTTAIWGSAPGAASAMVLMAEAFGADARLVAFMQYVRVIMVSLAAAIIAGFFVDVSGVVVPHPAWFPALQWPAFGLTLLIALAGAVGGNFLRLPAAMFLGPMILGVALHAGAGLPLQLPPWLLGASYATVGWTIGLRFNRAVLAHALRSLPQIMISVLVLIAFCGGVAWLLVHYLGIDPLTSYLATSPGGMDSVAIIAAASGNVDIAFVMALQMMRFLIVLLAGPPVARYFAGKAG